MQKITPLFSELDRLKSVAVGVSGGADSMALVHMLNRYASLRKTKLQILAITIDHGMRPESAAEAKKVARWLSKYENVTHQILRWDGTKPKTGKMEGARTARYALMAQICLEHKIKILAVAHHADDQAETFLMRVAHGSGLDGLAGMKGLTAYNDALTLYRPLLMMQHAELTAYCKTNKIRWVEDPTNVNNQYTRSRLRAALADEGLNSKRLGLTLQRLERASSALSQIAKIVMQDATIEHTENGIIFDLEKLKAQPFEMALRVIRGAMETLGHSPYGPRLEKLEELSTELLASKRKTKATLGGCLLAVDPRGNCLKITREACF